MRFRLTAVLTFALALTGASQAFAAPQAYFVHGLADSPLATCQPITGVPGYNRCDSVRSAVNAANANPNGVEEGSFDSVYLQAAGIYTVNSQLTLGDDIFLYGRGPRTTTIRSSGLSRVIAVPAGQSAFIHRIGIAGGRAGAAEGGNVLNEGDLYLINTRVTDGVARGGGGIANVGGVLSLLNSLVDHNTATDIGFGGGILSRTRDTAETFLQLVNSTVAFNTVIADTVLGQGAGIATTGSESNETLLTASTIARNRIVGEFGGGIGAGLFVGSSGESATVFGSLVGQNLTTSGGLANCGGAGTIVEQNGVTTNVEDGSSCFELSGNLNLSEELENLGGDTDVVTFAGTVAKNVVPEPCNFGGDQRSAPRVTGACDAGAWEQGAQAPAIDSGPLPEPVPVQPTPTQEPTPEPAPLPAPPAAPAQEPVPVFQQTVVAREVSGTIRVRRPGSREFVDLDATQGIPLGSTVDAKQGVVEISAVPRAGAAPEKATFRDGIFRLSQSRGITSLTLTEALAACPRRGARAAQRKPKTRKLFGDGRGSFRTVGRYSAATVRGTKWLVQDTCAGTLTRVTQGTVLVRDNVLRRNVTVRAGGRYLARPRR